MTDPAARARARLGCILRVRAERLECRSEAALPAEGYRAARLRLATGRGEALDGYLALPAGAGPHPALLYVHAHGNRHDIGARELLEGRPALLSPLGPVLARAGFALLCIDLPCFGSRAATAEGAAAKARLWQGGTLAGDMLGDLAAAYDLLAAHPEVDAARIGLFGLSMGATLATWLAATDPRPRALAQILAFADLATLVASGAHDLHGPYLTVPGLLRRTSTGRIAGLVAPRPQLVATGALDPLTPEDAWEAAAAELRAAYAGAPGALRLMRAPGTGHAETPAMRAAVLAFLGETLGTGT